MFLHMSLLRVDLALDFGNVIEQTKCLVTVDKCSKNFHGKCISINFEGYSLRTPELYHSCMKRLNSSAEHWRTSFCISGLNKAF